MSMRLDAVSSSIHGHEKQGEQQLQAGLAQSFQHLFASAHHVWHFTKVQPHRARQSAG